MALPEEHRAKVMATTKGRFTKDFALIQESPKLMLFIFFFKDI